MCGNCAVSLTSRPGSVVVTHSLMFTSYITPDERLKRSCMISDKLQQANNITEDMESGTLRFTVSGKWNLTYLLQGPYIYILFEAKIKKNVQKCRGQLFFFIFHPPEIVSCCRNPQLQVG